MTAGARLAVFVAGCAAVFGLALGAGHLAGPIDVGPAAAEGHGMDGMAAHGVGGLETSADGYTLSLAAEQLPAGRQQLGFAVTGSDGRPVTSYDERHERDLHLVVVRRDLTGFQHLHPTLDQATGEWSIDVDLTPGAWRVIADFVPEGGEQQVLGTDLLVAGDFAPEPMGVDAGEAHVDGYDVSLERTMGADEETVLTATVTRSGVPVTDLEPYLGAYGHLVVLRDGDVGYLHVHPEEGAAGPEIAFRTQFPSAGRYRLFLDFQHEGIVHTAVFTVTVDESGEGEHGH